jgi:uncharacterized spore protein YtfJ
VTTQLQAIVDQAREAVTARRAVAEPYERDGVSVVPVAIVLGGGGGGGADGAPSRDVARGAQDSPDGQAPPRGQQSGAGGGYGLVAWPVGSYVLAEGKVSWQPAVNVNLIVLGGQVVALVAILVGGVLGWRWIGTRR